MQEDDDGSGGHPSAYANPEPNRNMVSFELPSDHDDDDRWIQKLNPVFDKLGRPKAPNGYRWSNDPDFGDLTDDDRSYRDYMGRAFWEAGITDRQRAKIERAQLEHVKTWRDAQAEKGRNATKMAREELKKEWGERAADRIEKANALLRDYGGRDASILARMTLSDGSPLASSAAFVRLLANAAEAVPARKGPGGDAQSEIRRIQKEAMAQGLDPTSRRWPHEELDQLYRQVYGSAELDTTNSLPPGSRAR